MKKETEDLPQLKDFLSLYTPEFLSADFSSHAQRLQVC